MTREPNWISLSKLGSAYDEELDVNASPDTPDRLKMRHRPISFTGQEMVDWQPGPAPDSEEAPVNEIPDGPRRQFSTV
ncbi:hypothetical protein [Mesorhizobium sp. M0768]|uniref:hypothetical protein n=1 Tax=Mesorhizobium sp. M0768 TaxID=2956996 RepID=UPI00333B34D8